MPLPAEDVELVREFVTGLNASMPPHVANDLRYRLDIYRSALTIVECRTMDSGNVTLLLAEIDRDPAGIFFG